MAVQLEPRRAVATFGDVLLEGAEDGNELAVTLQPVDHTLSEAEIEAVGARIVAAVNKATGGVLRS